MSKNNCQVIISELKNALKEHIESADVIDNQYISVLAKNGSLLKVAIELKEELGYSIPISCGGLDYPDENIIQIIYYISHPIHRIVINLKSNLERSNPKTPSLTSVWEAMSFHEREAYEMFGILFEGHSNLTPLLLPPTWKGGFPLRKDFKGEGVN